MFQPSNLITIKQIFNRRKVLEVDAPFSYMDVCVPGSLVCLVSYILAGLCSSCSSGHSGQPTEIA